MPLLGILKEESFQFSTFRNQRFSDLFKLSLRHISSCQVSTQITNIFLFGYWRTYGKDRRIIVAGSFTCFKIKKRINLLLLPFSRESTFGHKKKMAVTDVVLKQVLVCFPFCCFSSLRLSLSLSEHPFSLALDKVQ